MLLLRDSARACGAEIIARNFGYDIGMSRASATVNYLVLLLVIVIGVAAGNLLSNWLAAQIDAYRGHPAAGSAKGRTGAAQEGTRIPMPSDAFRAQQEQRRRDRDGVRLGQTCEEWRQAATQLKSETARDEMKKHCGLYERYVQDGVLPGKK